MTLTKVLIAAGGTGGHIFPGIAVAQELKRRVPEADIRFVGTERGLESKLVPKAGFPLHLLSAGALNNVPWSQRLVSLAKLPLGFAGAMKLLRTVRPQLVIGVGGYASGVIMLAAAFKRIPTLVVEPNALPGFTNRVLARWTDAAAVTFEESAKFFPGKAVLTGNPVRAEFENIPAKQTPERRDVLIFGGSQGARAINLAMAEAAPNLVRSGAELNVTHQTGEADFEIVRDAYEKAGLKADVRPFIHDMAANFEKADVLVCRAGATTVAEIAAAGKAAIFIPFPFAADDHQRKNAEAFVNAGAGRMIVQAELTGEKLANEILSLLGDPVRIAEMEKAGRKLSRSDAAGRVSDLAEKIAEKVTGH